MPTSRVAAIQHAGAQHAEETKEPGTVKTYCLSDPDIFRPASRCRTCLEAYIAPASFHVERKSPRVRTLTRNKKITGNRMSRTDALRMIKRRARAPAIEVS